ncbi:hypothetical protein H5410_003578 [Solanum commersonii]|uniref:cellulase n=1 Tax=Solanum commersonii TaxID=4109 RepID=A0A9J6B522_SOLCO|nr:hypothetical protein H5410_003578 [Solanum commersonii]
MQQQLSSPTVVLPRCGKQKINSHKVIIHEWQKQEQLWTPADIKTNPERESKLIQKIQTYIRKLESSSFWLIFLDQLQTPEIFDRFLKAVGLEGKMQMVIYGIGSIESYEPPRLQHVSECKNLRLADSRKHILPIRQFVKELPIDSRKHIIAIMQFVKERSIDPFQMIYFVPFMVQVGIFLTLILIQIYENVLSLKENTNNEERPKTPQEQMDQDNSQKSHSHTDLPNSPGKELYYSRSAKQSKQFFMSSKAGHNAPVFEKYQQKAKNFMCSCLAKDDRNTQKTLGSLIYRQRWNNTYFVTSAAFLATTYSDYLASAGKYFKCSSGSVSPNELLSFSKS